jgi:hypothetical protein
MHGNLSAGYAPPGSYLQWRKVPSAVGNGACMLGTFASLSMAGALGQPAL